MYILIDIDMLHVGIEIDDPYFNNMQNRADPFRSLPICGVLLDKTTMVQDLRVYNVKEDIAICLG